MRFNYEDPKQTTKAKVEILRGVVHHYKGVVELPWKYKVDDAHQVDRAEVEALKAVVGLFLGEELPEYLDPKPEPEPDENPDEPGELEGGKASAPPEGFEPDSDAPSPEEAEKLKNELSEKIEALGTEAPELAENLEALSKNLDEAGEAIKSGAVSGPESVPDETEEPKDE